MERQLKNDDYRFVLIRKKEKAPFEENWQTTANYSHSNKKIQSHVAAGGNIGILTGYGIIVFDCDCKEAENIAKQFGSTFVVGTSTTEGGFRKKHYYFRCSLTQKHVLKDHGEHLGEIQAKGQQCLVPPSVHPSGAKYEVLEDNPIGVVGETELLKAISPFISEMQRVAPLTNGEKIREGGRNERLFKLATSMRAKGASQTEIEAACVTWNANRCEPPLSVMEVRRIASSASKYDTEKKIGSALKQFTDYVEMAKHFHGVQPFFYDKWKSWWLWNFEENKYERIDETDIMNALDSQLASAEFTIRTKQRAEILEALRRVGRKKIPKEFPKTWIQFRSCIIDIMTGEDHESTFEYFCTNPIPWDIGTDAETPIINRILIEWAGPNYVKTLKEIIAYSLLQDYPLHRLFCLTGSGSNGKGKYLELIKRFVGEDNVVSTSLERLIGGRFETAILHKKLVAMMGETNFRLLEKTDILKRAVGQDLLPGEFKGKTPFQFHNYAKIIIATNTLPATTDKTIGFYRRWLIIDFPNKFSEKKDIIEDIPEKEYSALARQCIDILRRIITEREFTHEGTEEDRARRFEERSNPVLIFLKKRFVRGARYKIPFSEVAEAVTEFNSENGFREMSFKEISSILRAEGYEIKTANAKRHGENLNCKWVFGLDFSENVTDVTDVTQFSLHSIYNKPNMKNGNMGNMGNIHNGEVTKNEEYGQKYEKWCQSKDIRPREQIIKEFDLKWFEYMKTYGLIFEVKPGIWRPT